MLRNASNFPLDAPLCCLWQTAAPLPFKPLYERPSTVSLVRTPPPPASEVPHALTLAGAAQVVGPAEGPADGGRRLHVHEAAEALPLAFVAGGGCGQGTVRTAQAPCRHDLCGICTGA